MSQTRNTRKKEPEECDDCGAMYWQEHAHRTVCPDRCSVGFEDNQCSLCGERYEEYMTHITEACTGKPATQPPGEER